MSVYSVHQRAQWTVLELFASVYLALFLKTRSIDAEYICKIESLSKVSVLYDGLSFKIIYESSVILVL